MVFVKVRETYDLHTIKNKMSVIAIHTPKSDIIKLNFPGLLMQCKAWRPVSADVRLACASVLPLDPLGVGTADGDVSPEDVFNPILYKATSNFGMSQIEARINYISTQSAGANADVAGNTAVIDVDTVTSEVDEFPIYYGLLSNAHEWKHANPQSGLEMTGLRPYVYELLYNVGDNTAGGVSSGSPVTTAPALDSRTSVQIPLQSFRGNAKPMPWLNTTAYVGSGSQGEVGIKPGFDIASVNCETSVPSPHVVCGCIIIPPSRLHELFYRMVVEWTIEFSSIRPLSEITDWIGLGNIAVYTHYKNYDYSATKEAVTGSPDTVLDSDVNLASANVDIKKVM